MALDLASPHITAKLERWRVQDKAEALAKLNQWTERLEGLAEELERDIECVRYATTLAVDHYFDWRALGDLKDSIQALKESAE